MGDGGVWILAPSLTALLSGSSICQPSQFAKRPGGAMGGGRKIRTTEREKQGRGEDEGEKSFSEGEHISRWGARFGRGDVCFPRGTTTFHRNAAKMLFRLLVLLCCQSSVSTSTGRNSFNL